MAKIIFVGIQPENKKIPLESQYRNLYLLKSLADKDHQITCVMKLDLEVSQNPDFQCLQFESEGKLQDQKFFTSFDAALSPLELCPPSLKFPIPLILNLQAPIFSTTLPAQDSMSEMDSYYFSKKLARFLKVLRHGDFFICTGKTQRLFYLGMLNALGKINPLSGDSIDQWMALVPPCSPSTAPQKTRDVLPAEIRKAGPVILWPSGVYPWYAPFCVIEAMPLILKQVPHAQLVFAGASNPAGPKLCEKTFLELKKRVREQHLEKNVHFTDWLDYADRGNLYLESAVGVCTYHPSFETEMSWRGRILDMLWGRLPVITSGGDDLSELILEYQAGFVVRDNSPEKLTRAIVAILTNAPLRTTMLKNVEKLVSEKLSWEQSIEPLHQFCKAPKKLIPFNKAPALNNFLDKHIQLSMRDGFSEKLFLKMQKIKPGAPGKK